MDKGKLCGMVLLDLQKAFETVNHSILLLKVKAMDVSNTACKWIKSYLENRCQIVDLNGGVFGLFDHFIWGSARECIRSFTFFYYILMI